MRALDASSIIHGWDHYPLVQFPPLWDWLGRQITRGDLVICEVALEEVKKRSPDCHAWLTDVEIQKVRIGNEALQAAAAIEKRLRLINQKYNKAGVGENDILIIASAQTEGHELMSNEGRQENWRDIKVLAKYKIPTVCQLPEVSVPCLSFIEYIRQSGEVFGGEGKA